MSFVSPLLADLLIKVTDYKLHTATALYKCTAAAVHGSSQCQQRPYTVYKDFGVRLTPMQEAVTALGT